MKKNFENDYINLVKKILSNGIEKNTRNGKTIALFGEMLEIDSLEYGEFPIITTKKMYYKGILGEFAAIIRSPKHINDFKKYGCNYRDSRAKKNGDINIDYGNKRFDFNGTNQIKNLIYSLKNNPDDRRMLIQAWDPSNIKNLDLPCCHYGYQFFVRDGKLDLLRIQRSADMMVGVPADIVLAGIMLTTIAKESGLEYGTIKMVFGDCHIYEEHIENANIQINNKQFELPKFILEKSFYNFVPENMKLLGYNSNGKIDFILKK